MLALMTSRRFAPLFWTQFLSAFNDNFLKNAIVFFILFRLASNNSEALVTLAGAIFIAPSFPSCFQGWAASWPTGSIRQARTLKAAEIAAASVAATGFWLGSLAVLFSALFLFGTVSALFGPIKYGILPDHLSFHEIPTGNALVESATFIAILLGAIAGGVAAKEGHTALFGGLMMVLAVACWLVSKAIPATAEAAPALAIDRNPLHSSLELMKDLWDDTRLWRAGVMVALFWLIGALIVSLAPALIKLMGRNELVVSVYLAEFSIAIAIGSGLGSYLSTGRVVLAIDFAVMAIMGGIFVVPAFSAVQVWAPNAKRARIVGAVNILSSVFIFAGALAISGMQKAGWSISGVFLVIGTLSLLSAAWIYRTMPTSPLRFPLAPLSRTLSHRGDRSRREAAGEALYKIMSDLIFHTTPLDRTIFEDVIEAARIHGKDRIALEDPVTGKLTYKRALIGARVLGPKLMKLAGEGEAVGVMLPTSNGAALTVLGLMSANRVPAMINFTSGAANISSACRAAQISTIVTSRAFVEKAKLEKLIEQLRRQVALVYLENVRKSVTLFDKVSAALRHEKPLAKAKPSDRAVILFTSGSEGTPKGVVLSHANMLANVAQAAARIDFGREDKVFNVLPVFHSFGLTIGLVLPLVSGVPVYLYPSPLHFRFVPELVYGSNATVLFGTDTFLTGYARTANAYDFRSIRYIVAGAEPVRPATRTLYMEKFGLRILEGYGVTETAPVLALNTPMFSRSGTVGRVLPGIETHLEHVEGVADGGRLFVRGPNVTLGYLKADKPGVLEPVSDGWHDTGDIVSIDRSGFVTIKGRAKRFAKIGGEMVSLAAVEELASQCWPAALSAAAALPDARKGQRLVLLTQENGASRAAFQQFAKAKGAADLMIPSEVLVVEALPLLGSGKARQGGR